MISYDACVRTGGKAQRSSNGCRMDERQNREAMRTSFI